MRLAGTPKLLSILNKYSLSILSNAFMKSFAWRHAPDCLDSEVQLVRLINDVIRFFGNHSTWCILKLPIKKVVKRAARTSDRFFGSVFIKLLGLNYWRVLGSSMITAKW